MTTTPLKAPALHGCPCEDRDELLCKPIAVEAPGGRNETRWWASLVLCSPRFWAHAEAERLAKVLLPLVVLWPGAQRPSSKRTQSPRSLRSWGKKRDLYIMLEHSAM